MAKNNREHVDSSDSSDKESAEETGYDSEPELTQTPARAGKKPQPASKPQEPPESGSSDSDGPIPEDSPIPSRTKPSAAKKPRAAGNDTKRARKKSGATDTPKNQRFWSEGDEIVILQGMIDYKAKMNADPVADVKKFHDFISNKLVRKEFEKRKLQDKIRKLRIKYETKEKKKEDGEEMTFSKLHEGKVFELSKSVWGNKKENEDDQGGAAAESESVLANGVKSIGATVEERILMAGEKKWKKLVLEEMQANLRLWEVKTAQARLVVEHLKSQWK